MNLFSTDVFLRCLGEVRYGGRPQSVEHCAVGGKVWRLLWVDGRPVTAAPFLDFFQPLEGAPPPGPRPLGYLPRGVRRTTAAEERALAVGESPSPYVDWSRFPTWESFESHVGARIGNLLPDSGRKARKAAKELGPLRFTLADPEPAVLERCLKWKSEQYLASGYSDLFADPANVALFRALIARGAVVVTSLFAGETLLAAHLAGLWENRLYWWVPAYDPAHSKYSPGRLLLIESLKESHRRGHREFDFLIGDEGYKWHFATHNRVVGEIGRPPLSVWGPREAKRRLKASLGRYPRALEAARQIKKRLGR